MQAQQPGNGDKNTAAKPSTMNIDWKKGISCYFDIDDITITVWASSWSGMESVSIDGEVISSFRGWGKSSSHTFSHGGIDYEVRIACQSLMSGQFAITLLREGQEVDSDQGSVTGVDVIGEDGTLQWGTLIRKIGPVFLLSAGLGMVFGYTMAKLFL